jgi:pimeloyl-ACP methyl ester carboxylesterase
MNAVYDIETQVSRLKRFADAMGFKKFHIAGNSMGGSIAGVFAVYHEDMVITLALVNSSGVKSPEKAITSGCLRAGGTPAREQRG